jgi:hypothetical protein
MLHELEHLPRHTINHIQQPPECLLLMLWTAPPPARECHECGCADIPRFGGAKSCNRLRPIGLDIANSVFQVHGIDAAGQVVMRRQLKRRYVLKFFEKLPPCLVGIEACASSHHWSRELQDK